MSNLRLTRILPLASAAVLAFLISPGLSAEDDQVSISEELPFADIFYEGKRVRIERIQDPNYRLSNSFCKTSRKCPPFCIHPIKAAPGVNTVGEIELLDFLLTSVKQGKGILVDARTPAWHKKGTIPGAVNIPFTVATAPTQYSNLVRVLKALGGKQDSSGKWDFRDAKQLMLFCNGPWCDQSPRAIKGLMRVGYPPEKLFYYRGGLQMWQLLGLTTVVPGS